MMNEMSKPGENQEQVQDDERHLQDDSYIPPKNHRTVFIGNIPYNVKWIELKEFLSPRFGTVKFVKYVHHVTTGRFLGAAFVYFETAEIADVVRNDLLEKKVVLNGRVLRGGYLKPKNKSNKKVNAIERSKEDTKVDGKGDYPSDSSISCLDEDCWTHVLSYVDPLERIAMERVCRQWQRCVARASTQQRILVIRNPSNGPFGNRLPESKLCRVIAQNCNNLVSLDLSLVPSKVKKSAVETIASSCTKLEKLDISGAYVSNHGVGSIVERCTRIKWLKIEGCPRITEKGLWDIFKHCKQLETLICYANRFSGNCFKIAPESLKELYLRNCDLKAEKGVLYLSTRCPNLTTLNLNNCKVYSLKSVADIFEKCHYLKDVNIGHFTAEKPSITVSLSRHPILSLTNPRNITKLMIDKTNLEDGDLQYVCNKCVNLIELDISCNPLHDKSVSHLSALTKLESLHICHVPSITNSSLTNLVTNGKLKCLQMQGCENITDELFELMAMSCNQLEELDIAGVVHASPKTLAAFYTALDNQNDRKITIYAFNNAFLDDENTQPKNTANVSVCVFYRRLYASHTRSLLEEDLDLSGMPADLDDLDDGGFMDGFCHGGDGDEFLTNDDPLENERWDMS